MRGFGSIEIGRRAVAGAAVALVLAAGAGVAFVQQGDGGRTGGTPAATRVVAPLEPDAASAEKRSPGAMGAVDATSGAGTAAAPQPASQPAPAFTVANGPRIVRSGELRVRVRKGGVTPAFDRISSLAAANQGYVESSGQQGDDEHGHTADLVVRVPADRFDAVRSAIGALGKVTSASLRGEDVTAQLVDFDARVKSLQAQEQALQALVARAQRVGEVLEVQGQLFDVRRQIEQLQAQRSQLDTAASFATLHVAVEEPGAVATRPPEPARGIAASADQAIDAAVAVLGGTLVVLGYAVPLGALALIGWGAAVLVRRRLATTSATTASGRAA